MASWRGQPQKRRWKGESGRSPARSDGRVRVLYACFLLFASAISFKLFYLQVINHEFYEAFATGQHELFQELYPERGEIFAHDGKDGTLVAFATNQSLSFVYADPRYVEGAETTARAIGEALGWEEEATVALALKLANEEDKYEPIAHEVTDEQVAAIKAADLSGIGYRREDVRLYPEPGVGGHVLGFLGYDAEGVLAGKYGIEGYYDGKLTGTPGFVRSERDISGRLIAVGERSYEPAIDGADVVLTIDRNVQYFVCRALEAAVAKHQADGGSVVIIEPSTGRIIAMCGAPDFDPNHYGDVASITQFNNPVTFDAYEPGSIFKPLTMAAALDAGAVEPTTVFEDTGSVMVDGWDKPIGNAEGKVYGVVNMTQVLEDSINTGMIFSMREMGMETFVQYVKAFGFGAISGIELDTEMPGDIRSLDLGYEVYAATASFGQGITTTPLQIASAYAALANGGVLLQPHIVDEIRYADGYVEKTGVQEVRRVIQEKTSRLIGAMLVSVIENGHGKLAGVPGYYIAGKTGTAQVARAGGGYDMDATIGSFAGFGPVSNPTFAMVVRIDHPRDVKWAESTAAPLFGQIAEYLLTYYEVPPER